jgi:hypothetical protein
MRRAFFIAAVTTALLTTSFTAQEPPLAPVNLAPPSPRVEYGPVEGVIRLEFRAGKDKGDHRIVWKHEGAEIEAVRLKIGSSTEPMEFVALPDGIQVQGRAFTTICKSIEIRPAQLGLDPRTLPSAKSSGQFSVSRSVAGVATVTCGGFRIECTKLVLTGDKNRLEINPGPQTLQVKTKDAELRAANLTVSYDTGFRLTLNAWTAHDRGDAEGEKIQLIDQR